MVNSILQERLEEGSQSQLPKSQIQRGFVSKVAGIFDVQGTFTPIIVAIKLDLPEFLVKQLNCDEKIPNFLRPIWHSNFKMISEKANVKYLGSG